MTARTKLLMVFCHMKDFSGGVKYLQSMIVEMKESRIKQQLHMNSTEMFEWLVYACYCLQKNEDH